MDVNQIMLREAYYASMVGARCFALLASLTLAGCTLAGNVTEATIAPETNPPREIDSGNSTIIVLKWTHGPGIVQFKNHDIDVPREAWVSTDGRSYFYATAAPVDFPSGNCSAADSPRALIGESNGGCVLANFPGTACWMTPV